jgi:quercetin dioxygenase-like cupin family protein
MIKTEALVYRWDEIEEDHPIQLLHRKRIFGENILLAYVRLDKGCRVARHAHVSEQVAMIVSGHVRWTVGEEGTERQTVRDLKGGDVMVVPSNLPHSVDAIEDTIIIDVLSPPGAMGVDSQNDRAH